MVMMMLLLLSYGDGEEGVNGEEDNGGGGGGVAGGRGFASPNYIRFCPIINRDSSNFHVVSKCDKLWSYGQQFEFMNKIISLRFFSQLVLIIMKSICGINNGGSLRSVTQYYKDFSQVAYVRDCYSYQHTCVNIENDEVIARTLQEKLSRLSLQESIGSKSKASWKNCSFALDENTVTSSFYWEHGRLMERALSEQIYGSSEHHELVRGQVIKQLESHKELNEGHVPMDYDEYVKKMIKCGEWGDHVTLQAAADLYGVNC
ncbi:hypothetical protein CQW23_24487 [Capsicum baccatum]|uniref:OTU domain-containing protein n=1 Tax=Capsicum baccatum TaxID=33114 RepID=A0A2G2VUY1_CAPBA|nr:hypothetical protein CQW23_24487 [Capsicum baccatum]